MDARDFEQEDGTEESENSPGEEFQQLWQIRAVREAVIKNLKVRMKRDDDKVAETSKKIDKIFEQPWYKSLGGVYLTVKDYSNNSTDLQVTYLSIIKEQETYINELNAWSKKLEGNAQEIKTMQKLNDGLSVQLKDQDNQVVKLKRENEQLKKDNAKLASQIATVAEKKKRAPDESEEDSDENN